MSKKPVKAEVLTEVHPTHGPRPDFYVVVSHCPHTRGQWQVSDLQRDPAHCRDIIKRCGLTRATIVKIPAEATLVERWDRSEDFR